MKTDYTDFKLHYFYIIYSDHLLCVISWDVIIRYIYVILIHLGKVYFIIDILNGLCCCFLSDLAVKDILVPAALAVNLKVNLTTWQLWDHIQDTCLVFSVLSWLGLNHVCCLFFLFCFILLIIFLSNLIRYYLFDCPNYLLLLDIFGEMDAVDLCLNIYLNVQLVTSV
ncbi:hypothetical protein ACJX0J_012303 [Zea mays]